MPRSGPAAPGPSALWARLIGIAVLAALLGTLISYGPGLSPPWRRLWFDYLQRIDPRDRSSPPPAVVVLIDDETISRFGQWPWPRSDLAHLTFALNTEKPDAIGFDILFADPDRFSPERLAQKFQALRPEIAAELRELPATDDQFRDEILYGKVVLPSAGRSDEPVEGCPARAPWAPEAAQAPVDPDGALRQVDCFWRAIDPLGDFAAASDGLAAISFKSGPDGVVRRLSAVQQFGPRYYAMLGPETLRAASGAPRVTVTPSLAGARMDLGEYSLPIESDGGFWMRFGRRDLSRYVVAAEVRSGEADLSLFKDKIVLVAVSATSAGDTYLSPLGEEILGVEVHLQMIEQIVEGTFLRRPAFLYWIEVVLCFGLGAFVIWRLPEVSPLWSVISVIGIVGSGLFFAWVAFRTGVLIDAASPALTLTITAGAVGAVNLIVTEQERLKAELALSKEREALANARAQRAKLQGELEAAGRIQESLLPPATVAVEDRLDLACLVSPARIVGGDFFDHFMVDNRRLFFSVADVSDKGAFASLFMAVSKSLWKSVALRHRWPLEEIQLEANNEISRDNADTMFVTALCGLLDLETLELSYSSAGHDAPLLFGKGRVPEQLPSYAGPPAGIVAGIEFPVGHMQLAPGDRLCVFTDGVTEAMNADRELFGLDRLIAALTEVSDGHESRAVVDHIRAAVTRFAGAAEQSDDLTLMVLTISETGAPLSAPE